MDIPNYALWRRVRLEVLERDHYRCKVRGPKCDGRATTVDHIVPRADGGAIFDKSNLRAACGWCNTWRATQQKNREGWKRSHTHIVLVMGPPGAGAGTYAAGQAALRGGMVIDYEAIAQALGPAAQHELVNKMRGTLLTQLRRGEVEAQTAWIVSANPKAASMFPFHEVVVIDPGRDAALQHCGLANAARVDAWYATRAGKTPRREW